MLTVPRWECPRIPLIPVILSSVKVWTRLSTEMNKRSRREGRNSDFKGRLILLFPRFPCYALRDHEPDWEPKHREAAWKETQTVEEWVAVIKDKRAKGLSQPASRRRPAVSQDWSHPAHTQNFSSYPSLDNHSTVVVVRTRAPTEEETRPESPSNTTSYLRCPLCGLIAFVHQCQRGRVMLKDPISKWARLQSDF